MTGPASKNKPRIAWITGAGGGAGVALGGRLGGGASRTASEPRGLPCLGSSNGSVGTFGSQPHSATACRMSDSANATQTVEIVMRS